MKIKGRMTEGRKRGGKERKTHTHTHPLFSLFIEPISL